MPDLTPFQLSLAGELEAFRPEIHYVCRFLERAHGLRLSENAGQLLHYGPNPPASALSVPAVFFPKGVKLSDKGVFPDRVEISAMLAITSEPFLFPPNLTFGDPVRENLSYDALGLIFFLISRIEEREPLHKDQYGRFAYAGSFHDRMGGPQKPWADHAARDIARGLMQTGTPPNASGFKVILTHDVDRLKSYHRLHLPLRYALGDAIKRRKPLRAIATLKNGYLSGEPWRSFNEIMALSEAKGLPSRFFFMGPSEHPMDSTYARTMVPLLQSVASEVSRRGHFIGFHPGYVTQTDAALWNKQRDSLEELIGVKLTEGRQHVLRYEVETTPSIWADAGMTTDYTMTFPETPGFRTGTCRAYSAYDLKRRRCLSVDLIATSITDFGLMDEKYQNLSAAEALDACRLTVKSCQEFGGRLCILFHSSNPNAQMAKFYASLLETLP